MFHLLLVSLSTPPPPPPTHESYLVLPPPLWSLLAGKPGLSVTDQFVPVHLLGLTCLVRWQFSPILNWQCIQITTTEQNKRPFPHTHIPGPPHPLKFFIKNKWSKIKDGKSPKTERGCLWCGFTNMDLWTAAMTAFKYSTILRLTVLYSQKTGLQKTWFKNNSYHQGVFCQVFRCPLTMHVCLACHKHALLPDNAVLKKEAAMHIQRGQPSQLQQLKLLFVWVFKIILVSFFLHNSCFLLLQY